MQNGLPFRGGRLCMYECIFMKILGLFSGALFLEHVTQEVNTFVDGFR